MSALAFVNALLETGRVRVPMSADPPEHLDEAVLELDLAARPELPFEPPPLSVPAGAWALTILYRGCQSLVFREIDPDAVRDALSRPCPVAPSPASCYSVDLAFRYLPDLLSLARGLAPSDPLVTALVGLARQWPLSSVGVALADDVAGDGPPGESSEHKDQTTVAPPPDVSPFIDHPALRQLYADRIIEKSDASRLADSRARAAVRASLGAHPELAPRLAAAAGAAP